jgi:CBS domain-containing protein
MSSHLISEDSSLGSERPIRVCVGSQQAQMLAVKVLEFSIRSHTAADVVIYARTAQPDQLAAGAVGLMERYRVMALPVLDEDRRVVGIVHLHDLMRAGAV